MKFAEAKQARQCEEFKRILKQAAKQIKDIAMLLNAEKWLIYKPHQSAYADSFPKGKPKLENFDF